MFLSALFAFQNIGDVTVKFVFWQWTLPQGVWEVVLFSTGAAVMWFFSLFSVFEVRSKLKKQLKEKDDKIAALMDNIVAGFTFDRVEKAEKELLGE